jgi:hypothetical protein
MNRQTSAFRSCFLVLPLLFTSAVLAAPADDLPVPKFDQPYHKPSQRRIAEELRASYEAMRRHLCEEPAQLSQDRKQKYRELLLGMMASEHMVVWAAAGDFTRQEADALNTYSVAKENIRHLFYNAPGSTSANRPEIARLLEILNRRTNDLTATANSSDYGRSILVVNAARAALGEFHKEVRRETLEELRISREYDVLFERAARGLAQTYRRIYARAIADINKLIPATAPRFVIHSSPDVDSPMFIKNENAVFAKTIGRNLDPNAFYLLPSSVERIWYSQFPVVDFSEAERAKLRGECKKKLVRVLYNASREADAKEALKILRENGFEVEARAGGDGDTPRHAGKLYYAKAGDKNEAVGISTLVRSIEAVVATPARGASNSDNPPDYTLWIVGKQVRSINYYVRPRDVTTLDAAGQRLTVRCLPNPRKSYAMDSFPTYGTDIYFLNSAICPAAVHAGVIGFAAGGIVTIEHIGMQRGFVGSRRNEVITKTSTGPGPGFRFVN